MFRLLLLPLFLIGLVGCPPTPPAQSDDDDDSAVPEPAVLPEIIPTEWLENMDGTITHVQTYTQGYDGLVGTECTEVFAANGANITPFQPNPCDQCELVFELFTNRTSENCLGDDVLEEDGEMGLDLLQQSGTTTVYWYDNGFWGWGAGWDELVNELNTLVQNEDDLTLDLHFEFDDPRDNPSTSDGDCGWLPNDRCQWDGRYFADLQLHLDAGSVQAWQDEQAGE